jgi:hypothetical protein
MTRIRFYFDRHWSFIVTDRYTVFPFLAIVICLAIYGSYNRQDWELIGRSGNIFALAGGLMSLRVFLGLVLVLLTRNCSRGLCRKNLRMLAACNST